MVNSKLISIVVICYEQENTIRRALDSILRQEMVYTFEIIIGEDASPNDNTRAICEEYVQKYPEVIRLLPVAENKGLLRNYADCLAECQGKYIATCTGDDWWHNPNKLKLQVDFLEHNQDYGVVHTEANFFDPISNKHFYPAKPRNCPEGAVLTTMFKINFIYAISAMFRRDLLKYADFEEWIRQGFVAEDHAMWLAFAPHTLFHYLPESTITYCSALESASRSLSVEKRLKFIKGICHIQQYFHDRIKPSNPSYKDLIHFQQRWLIHEILLKKDYGKLKEYAAPLIIRLAPFPYFFFKKVKLKFKFVWLGVFNGRSPIEFM
jgi:glycosyltransferase involved in cell wall biosynthesis